MEAPKKLTVEYSYERLTEILVRGQARLENKNIAVSREEKALFIAAAYAQDMVDYASRQGVMLNLTYGTEPELAKAIRQYLFSGRISADEAGAKEDLVKMLRSYELFAMVNSMNSDRKRVTIGLLEGETRNEDRLEIRSLPGPEGRTWCFDVFSAARETVNRLWQIHPLVLSVAAVREAMAPFYRQGMEELTNHLPVQ